VKQFLTRATLSELSNSDGMPQLWASYLAENRTVFLFVAKFTQAMVWAVGYHWSLMLVSLLLAVVA